MKEKQKKEKLLPQDQTNRREYNQEEGNSVLLQHKEKAHLGKGVGQTPVLSEGIHIPNQERNDDVLRNFRGRIEA